MQHIWKFSVVDSDTSEWGRAVISEEQWKEWKEMKKKLEWEKMKWVWGQVQNIASICSKVYLVWFVWRSGYKGIGTESGRVWNGRKKYGIVEEDLVMIE